MDKIFKEVPVRKLFKDCLMMAKYVGKKQGNEKVLLNMVRTQFKMNMAELDDDKVKEQKEAAVRALHNVYLVEADRYVRGKPSGGQPKP
uniref:Uncharacterized protein n=1 Tax=Polytomella parva TaxID=51329 RepID=A0A7S0VE14_9CHLO